MRNKTLLSEALETVPSFAQSYEKFRNRMLIDQKSELTIAEYSRKISAISLHFGILPKHLSDDQIDSYLGMKLSGNASKSMFKHIVFGLRYYFRALGVEKKSLRLPRIKKDRTLPVVLNQDECKRLFCAPTQLKHKVILSLIYSAGLRVSELTHLRVEDIDSVRMLIHVHCGKNRKDRYLPLSNYILRGLRKYFLEERPQGYLFCGYHRDKPMSNCGVEWIMREACKKAVILKKATPHTLRHTYATHLLEMGVDILRVKDLLGHADIKTTMVYLHVINTGHVKAFSPLDKLYPGQV